MALRFQAPSAFFESEFLPQLCVITGQTENLRPARVLFPWQPPWQLRARSRWVTFTTPTPSQAAWLGTALLMFLKTGVGVVAGLLGGPLPWWLQLFFATGMLFIFGITWGFERLMASWGSQRLKGLTLPVATQGRRRQLALWADFSAWILYNSGQYAVVLLAVSRMWSGGLPVGPVGLVGAAAGFSPVEWIGVGVAVFLGLVAAGLHLLPLVFFFPRLKYDARADLVTVFFRREAQPIFDAYLAGREAWVAVGGDRSDDDDDEDDGDDRDRDDEDEDDRHRRGW